MYLTLREGLSYGLCSGRVVLLDAPADRYLCLPPSCQDAFLELAGGRTGMVRRPEIDRLLSMGVVCTESAGGAFPAPAWIEPAARDLEYASEIRSAGRDVAGAIAAEFATVLERRLLSLDQLLARIDRAACCRTDCQKFGDDARLASIAAAFLRTSLIFPAAGRCLARGLALMRLCRWRGLHPRLVLGVRLDPFAAHCWVQHRDAVLIGGLEQARLFTPVRVVG